MTDIDPSGDGDEDVAVVLVSNRGPVEFGRENGERTSKRGGGGLVTALSSLSGRLDDVVWVCGALSDEDAVVSRERGGKAFEPEGQNGLKLRMVETDPEAHDRFYNVISNPLLWFVQHYLWGLSTAPDITPRETEAFHHGYVPVNEAFADAVVAEVEARDGRVVVMVQDYHFYLLPQLVRERCPEVFLHHFVHIPWPQPDAWRVLPPAMREAVLLGILGNDVVAFHTEAYARNFLLGCQELLGLEVDLKRLSVQYDDRTVRARWYPISVDAAEFEARAASPAVREHEERLLERRRDHLILRVDRADLSKNIVRGFRAYDALLDAHPELRERVTFLALIQPSRQDVDAYVEYLERIRRVVADVNLKHGTSDWQPIDLRLGDDLDRAVAAYKLFDLLVVNAIFDGMNLVAKEAVLVNEHDGVLALSENTGAHEELGAFALTLHPFDIHQQAEAFHEGLMMDRAERRERLAACVGVIRNNDIGKWLREQLREVRRLRDETAG
ncbi:MAG TPA: trehalose-6-phosphate synthase [Acidimicrobiales bacterium]|jgi:trehalose 6-phosphate synthase|nr:trehalose-6-phosphate synthase [Acidimicrobiales bacterium]